jgi:hypothetical protein
MLRCRSKNLNELEIYTDLIFIKIMSILLLIINIIRYIFIFIYIYISNGNFFLIIKFIYT